ncbi:hypothetical protein I7I50_10279 [Histoplasma capsulatum G186AR]|uniref:Uncharacterized protein n=1 Tax=Ajellomyces capsulatus TaxID=5037 RepID=A0A8H7Z447_AJECA|nr:hypothetical protein I7I52_01518 [Histoplasma capsulatum]QSS69099.1 hypothetical protein I7I50_10279 [Histoplasma capsulatum G186AR]
MSRTDFVDASHTGSAYYDASTFQSALSQVSIDDDNHHATREATGKPCPFFSFSFFSSLEGVCSYFPLIISDLVPTNFF